MNKVNYTLNVIKKKKRNLLFLRNSLDGVNVDTCNDKLNLTGAVFKLERLYFLIEFASLIVQTLTFLFRQKTVLK